MWQSSTHKLLSVLLGISPDKNFLRNLKNHKDSKKDELLQSGKPPPSTTKNKGPLKYFINSWAGAAMVALLLAQPPT